MDLEAGDEVAEIIERLARLRARCRHAGPLVTSRIWKAEMQMKSLARETGPAVESPKKDAGSSVRGKYRHYKSMCAGTPLRILNDPHGPIARNKGLGH